MRRSTLILTTAGMILGGAAAIDLLEGAGTNAAPEPAASYNVSHNMATSHSESSSLAVVRGLLATEAPAQ
ncbi:hypothetical protein [Nocardia rhizosphaerihabitans]|uniref:Uncharacterized protein n=1 Tax=Nocardia rhizosphaerihabitans TaxID=1691570 RepID=A0ABQ2K897_9NOCA|nr:hypothetical protein [Nocardia rhizosphaerihabitans]GGN71066.1 hypothetical protein GCM10011610_10800 [Nocardia rhizosphaerihabitans]